jgi:hypothetical protein
MFVYITRLASNEIFSPSNKMLRELGGARDLSVPRYLRVGIDPISQNGLFLVGYMIMDEIKKQVN